jgi:hypothetical protein
MFNQKITGIILNFAHTIDLYEDAWPAFEDFLIDLTDIQLPFIIIGLNEVLLEELYHLKVAQKLLDAKNIVVNFKAKNFIKDFAI